MRTPKTICVVTGSRAEYGLLRWFMREVQSDPDLELQVLVTGMHVSESYGSTWKEIVNDGFDISRRVEMLEEDRSSLAVARSTGRGVTRSAEALAELAPDLLVVLGDRFEAFAAAVAATLLKIPIAHFHGGETTEGAFDESFRHCITKMSHFHFTAAEAYRNRVIQMGEAPERVFNVGAFGLDNAAKCDLLSKTQLEAATGIRFRERNLLVTFHPVTLEDQPALSQFMELIAALDELSDFGVVITHPNADPGSDSVADAINAFAARNSERIWHFKSLGFLRYLSAVQIVDAVVGNSSSGLIEAPYFGTPTVNIGDRQKGRLAGPTVVHCPADCTAIKNAIERSCSRRFLTQIAGAPNPYGSAGAGLEAKKRLKRVDLDGVLKKTFFDVAVG
ncbi:GDP/UDP-N,N'-diacetylbacillosamine 2-epimerase (hydrolyzing) [Stieleria neptunia]|uniref:GDP/UDP-N,N'-diacetylbacillosamine 2-epimerase (Hydrolyzing) n=1 Tax=Stieleria neptunia TaxID=2527979 RepID=A0A518HTT5_9BACT|nr:UDP-N-acetylglucosamine 2-epimerase [Stieleria neptunia]QDV44207.1 GDP/UDP-N,N'-diacetylbacillosamine 2-epimerase (hydrolyzing) [Stieleria neptunia]